MTSLVEACRRLRNVWIELAVIGVLGAGYSVVSSSPGTSAL